MSNGVMSQKKVWEPLAKSIHDDNGQCNDRCADLFFRSFPRSVLLFLYYPADERERKSVFYMSNRGGTLTQDGQMCKTVYIRIWKNFGMALKAGRAGQFTVTGLVNGGLDYEKLNIH